MDRAPINTFHLLRQIYLLLLLRFGSPRSAFTCLQGKSAVLQLEADFRSGSGAASWRTPWMETKAESRAQSESSGTPRYPHAVQLCVFFFFFPRQVPSIGDSRSPRVKNKQILQQFSACPHLGSQSNALLVNCQETISQSTKASHC